MFLIRAMCLVYYAPRRLLQIVGGVQIRSYSIISHSALLPWRDGGNAGVHGRTRVDQLQWETDCSLTPADLFCFLRISQWQNYLILLLLKYDWGRLEIVASKALQDESFVQICAEHQICFDNSPHFNAGRSQQWISPSFRLLHKEFAVFTCQKWVNQDLRLD